MLAQHPQRLVASLLVLQQLQRPLQGHVQDEGILGHRGVHPLVSHVGAVAADADLHGLAGVGMVAEMRRQAQQPGRQLGVYVVGLHPWRQRHPLGLLVVARRVGAKLQVGAVWPAFQKHGLLAAGERPHLHVALGRFPQVGLQRLPADVAGRQLVRQRGALDLAALDGPLDVGAVAAHTHDVGVPAGVGHGGNLAGVDVLEPFADPRLDAVRAPEEVAQVGRGGQRAGGDVVQRRLHVGRELGVDQPGELAFEQVVGGEGHEGGHQLRAVLESVAAPLHGVDDAGVGAGPADAFGFEKLDQRRLGVARGRLGFVCLRGQLPHGQRVALGQLRERLLAVVQGGVGVVGPLHVGAEEAGEERGAAAGPERRLALVGVGHDACGDELEPGIGHLGRHGTLPHQVVEGGLRPLEAVLVGGAHGAAGGTDGLVRLLGVARRTAVLAGTGAQIVVAVAAPDGVPAAVHRLLRQVGRVGAHVGDIAVLVELLGDAHGLACREPELAPGLLLQRGGGERGRRGACGAAFLHASDPPGRRACGAGQQRGAFGGERQHVAARHQALLEGTGIGVEVSPASQAHARQVRHDRVERCAGGVLLVELGLQVPVGRRREAHALLLAHDQQPHRHALHAARRELRGDLLPQQGADAVTHQPVQHAPRLLRVDQVRVDAAGGVEGREDGALGDLVEHHALHRHLRLEDLHQVPADRLPLAILVGCDVELVGALQRRAEVADHVLLARRDDVQRPEALLDIDAEPGPGGAFELLGDLGGRGGQVANVAHRRLDLVLRRQEAPDGPCLGGRLHDDESRRLTVLCSQCGSTFMCADLGAAKCAAIIRTGPRLSTVAWAASLPAQRAIGPAPRTAPPWVAAAVRGGGGG